jgi:membrane fusion protein, heavy metal efflux system
MAGGDRALADRAAFGARILELVQSLDRRWKGLAVGVVVLSAIALWAHSWLPPKPIVPSDISSQSRRGTNRYTPTAAEWASISVEPVTLRVFRVEHQTEGKISVDEDRSTPVFSPYAGRVTKLLAKPGDRVEQGQPLFVVEATDNVQAQNDFIAAVTTLNKAKSQFELAQIQNKRAQDLFAGKAIPLKDAQTAEAALVSAQNDVRSGEVALEAVRNRLRILGFNDDAIAAFQTQGRISPDTAIPAPLGGTVVQRKVGPGQYVATGATDPAFVIGDLSTVWVTAFVREVEAPDMAVGQDMTFTLLAFPGRIFTARINYVAAAIDSTTRRLTVRATTDNKEGLFKPEMFANVTIYSGSDESSVAVPKQALIYEGDQVRVWVANTDHSLELRQVKAGLTSGELVAVHGNLGPGDKVVTKGSLFIDRAASGS